MSLDKDNLQYIITEDVWNNVPWRMSHGICIWEKFWRFVIILMFSLCRGPCETHTDVLCILDLSVVDQVESTELLLLISWTFHCLFWASFIACIIQIINKSWYYVNYLIFMSLMWWSDPVLAHLTSSILIAKHGKKDETLPF